MIFKEIATGKKVKANNYTELFAFSHNSNYVLVKEEIKKEQNTQETKKGKETKKRKETKKQEPEQEIVEEDNEELVEEDNEELVEEDNEEIVVEDSEITEDQGEVIQ